MCERGKCRRGRIGLGEVREEREADSEAKGLGGSTVGSAGDSSGVDGAAARDKDRVVDGGARGTAGGMQGVTGSNKRTVIQMTEAEGDGTTLGHTIRLQGSSEALAEGVVQHSGAHGHDISEKLCEASVAIKGDAPAELAASIDHGREDLLRRHGAFAEGLARIGDAAGLVGCGDTASVKEAAGQVGLAMGARSGQFSSNISFQAIRLSDVAEEARWAGAASESPAAKHSLDVGA